MSSQKCSGSSCTFNGSSSGGSGSSGSSSNNKGNSSGKSGFAGSRSLDRSREPGASKNTKDGEKSTRILCSALGFCKEIHLNERPEKTTTSSITTNTTNTTTTTTTSTTSTTTTTTTATTSTAIDKNCSQRSCQPQLIKPPISKLRQAVRHHSNADESLIEKKNETTAVSLINNPKKTDKEAKQQYVAPVRIIPITQLRSLANTTIALDNATTTPQSSTRPILKASLIMGKIAVHSNGKSTLLPNA